MDFTEPHPTAYESYDFILSADVLEHIAPPVELAIEEVSRLLKPHGFFGITVYCHPSDKLREHFPGLHTYRTVLLGDSMVLINRRTDGALEIRDDLVFHGGTGATLEMREFGITSLKEKLLGAGFRDVHLATENVPAYGILFDADVSQPLIARKQPFLINKRALRELVDEWRAANSQNARAGAECDRLRTQMRMAAESRWLRLGRKLGLGPGFS